MGSASPERRDLSALNSLWSGYVRLLSPGESVTRLLEASLNPEVQAAQLATLIEANPLYSHYLEKLDILQEKVQQWRDEFPEEKGTEFLTRFISALLGRSMIRNAVLAIWMNRHAGQGLPRKPGVPFLIMPHAQLRYAISLWDYCEEKQLANPDLAYMAGFCFDWVGSVIALQAAGIKAEKKYLEDTCMEARRAARIAYEIAAVSRQLALSRFAFSATLLAYLGRVLMAVAHPQKPGQPVWKEFLKHCESHGGHRPLAQLVLEKRRFGFTHAEAAALCAAQIRALRPCEAAVRFYQEPYLLRTSQPDSYSLASIVSAAVTLGGSPGVASLSAQQRAALAELGVSETDLRQALLRASGKKED